MSRLMRALRLVLGCALLVLVLATFVPVEYRWRVASAFGLAAWSGFVVVYAALAPWWRSPIGRNLMTLAIALLAAFALMSAGAWLGPFPPWVWLTVVGLLGVTGVDRTALLIHAHRNAAKGRRD